MKKLYQSGLLAACFACLLISGCQRKSSSVWDDNKTASRTKSKQTKSLWGSEIDNNLSAETRTLAIGEEFIPLQEEDLKSAFADAAIPQPDETPGEEGSTLPGIDHFATPTAYLASIFRSVYFNTNDDILRNKEYLITIDKIASYLKEHKDTFIFVLGHCDERGPEAYNLALGSRRANTIRSLLVQKGVDLNQIHTISYGKERPIDAGHTPEAWQKNRRAEFKVYQKTKKR